MTTINYNCAHTARRYSRSFVSYEMPFRPNGVVSFAETEGLHSYYIAYYNDTGRVAQFDKILFVRLTTTPRDFRLESHTTPGTLVYFRKQADSADTDPALGDQIPHAETETLTEFFVGTVGPNGETGTASLYRKQTAFSDSYEYWRNGQLRQRTMSRDGLPPEKVLNYDKHGHLLAAGQG